MSKPISTDIGVNLIGRLQTDIGLGEAARRTLDALCLCGILVHDAALTENILPHHINLIYTGYPQVLAMSPERSHMLRKGRFTIAQFYWELPRLLKAYRPALEIADELWAASRFMQSIFANAATVPVQLMPPPVDVTPSPGVQREAFGLPNRRQIFFSNFNATSHYERKNPAGIIKAFQQAFGHVNADGPLLVIKSQYLEHYPPLYHHLSRLVDEVGGVLINSIMTRQQMTDLLACADVYVSLHRAEGFGLGMAEAMLLKKPVIATNYSGNCDFMTPDNSYPVGYTLRPITDDDHRYQPDFEAVYEAEQQWAEPDIDHAAEYMAWLYQHHDNGRAVGELAAHDIACQYAPAIVGQAMASHLAQIGLPTNIELIKPSVQPAPIVVQVLPPIRLPQAQGWSNILRRAYHFAVPTPIRLSLRNARQRGRSQIALAPRISISFRAAEVLARRYGHPHIVVVGQVRRDDIAAIAASFPVLLTGADDPPEAWDAFPHVRVHPRGAALPRPLLQQSVVVATLTDTPHHDQTLQVLRAAVETGALSIVSAPAALGGTLASLAATVKLEGLPVWLHETVGPRQTAIVAYPEAPFASPLPKYRVIAVVVTCNQVHALPHAVRRLTLLGVEVCVLDFGSTDGTADVARSLLGHGVLAVEDTGLDMRRMDIAQLRKRAEAINATRGADWLMLQDPNDACESFDPRWTLRETLYQIERGGFGTAAETIVISSPTADPIFYSTADQVRIWRPPYDSNTRLYPFNLLTWQTSADVESYRPPLLERLTGVQP